MNSSPGLKQMQSKNPVQLRKKNTKSARRPNLFLLFEIHYSLD